MGANEKRSDDTALLCLRQLAAASGELHGGASKFTDSMASAEWTQGLPYRDLLPLRRRLEMIEQVSTALRDLNQYGQLFRRIEARALYAEGLTMAQLASVFGVSRQRVSALLREPTGLPREAE
jgi:hypothetical protein